MENLLNEPLFPCILIAGLLALTTMLLALRQYLLIIGAVIVALAAMILPGGIAVLVGGLMLAAIYLLKKSGAVNVTIDNSPNSTVIIDQSRGADEKQMARRS